MNIHQQGGNLPVVVEHQHLQVSGLAVAVCRGQLGLGAADWEEVLQQGAVADCFLDLGGQGTGHYSGY